MIRSIQTILIILLAAAAITGSHFLSADAIDLSSGMTTLKTIDADVNQKVSAGSVTRSNTRLIPGNDRVATREGRRSILPEIGTFILLGSGLLFLAGWGKRKIRK